MDRTPPRKDDATRTMEASFPAQYRQRLEGYRLGFLALFQSLDALGLAQDIPPSLKVIMEADAAVAHALFVLDQPEGSYSADEVLAEVERITDEAAEANWQLLEGFSEEEREALRRAILVRLASVTPADAYYMVPKTIEPGGHIREGGRPK